MNTTRIHAKLYFVPNTTVSGFAEVFHEWIRTTKLGELMIDVVDYGHVHHGPHVYFCGHESDYIVDHREGRAGLVYIRKRVPSDQPHIALHNGLYRLLSVASMLERETQLLGLRFDTRELRLAALDREAVPNDASSFELQKPALQEAANRLFGPEHSLLYDSPDPREPFAVRIVAREAEALSTLVSRAS